MRRQLNGVAREVAPEDIRRGDFIAVLHELDENVPFLTAGDQCTTPVHVVRVWLLPRYPQAFRVLAVSLPFVLMEEHDNDKRLLDVRQVRIARLSPALGRTLFPRKKTSESKTNAAAVATPASASVQA